MKELFGHIRAFVWAWMCVLCMSSCVYDHYTDGDLIVEEPENADQALFVLHITPMKTRALEGDGVKEKIKSLRVIAVGKDENGENGVIEINRLVKFDEVASTDFSYAFTWYTTPGKKDFYIIANEESVGNISGCEDENVTTLTELLDKDKYKATPNPEDKIDDSPDPSKRTDNNKTASADDDDAILEAAKKEAAEFKEVMKNVYFAPKYEIKENEIFLPYTVCYEDVDVKAWKDNDNAATKQTMYLVPVATKFYFRFYNYHENDVQIKELSIKSIASQNFLLGYVDETEQKKKFDNDEMYWVDWLAMVAEKTRDRELDNEEVNDLYGWISAFQMPTSNQHNGAVLICEGNNNVATIPVWTKEKEDVLYLGPYYFPESRNEKDGDDGEKIQQYTLGLHLHDTEVDSSTSNDFEEELVIGNVKSLFRSTCVLIQVTMKKGEVEAYAETTDWEHKEVDGWAEGGSIIP